MVLASVVGLAAVAGRPAARAEVALIVLYFVSVSVVHALMFVEMRHRWAAEPLMLALVPSGVRALSNRLAGRV